MSKCCLITPAHIDEDLLYKVVCKVNDFVCEKNISFRKNPLKPLTKAKADSDFYDEFIECFNDCLNNGVKHLKDLFEMRIGSNDVPAELSNLAVEVFDHVMLNSSPDREVSVEEKGELKKSIISIF